MLKSNSSLISLIFFLFLVESGVADESTKFEVTISKKKWSNDRKIEVNQNSGKVVFNVYDKFGIGKADLEIIEGNWPKKVIIRCHFSGLEGFKLRILDKVYQKDELKIRACNEKGESIKEKYLLHYENGKSKKIPGYYEIEISKKIPVECKKIRIDWIDFYR